MNAIFKEQLPVQEFYHEARHLTVRWRDGSESRFDSMWLRDNCPEDRDPRNGQRCVDISELPPDPRIGGVSYVGNGILEIIWAGELKHSRFQLQWLWNYADSQDSDQQERPELVTWTGDRASELLWKDYSEVASSERARWQWLKAIAEYGIAFLENVPRKAQQLEELARLVGFIYETNYGRTFDVRSELNPNNLANSDWGLGLHTDNPYRNPVPGFQILHCLQACPEGGESFFADGFAVAEHLRTQDPVAFLLLATTPVRFTFQDASTDLSAERPLLQLNLRGELAAIHYNNRSVAPLSILPDRLRPFYQAYRGLAQLLRNPDFEFRIRLQSGDAVAFDNHRVLHGRAAFKATLAPRHLQGCYINRDSFFSNLRVLNRKFQEALP